jgi:hypothetical protein
MHDAEVRQDIVMRQVGHASPEISQRYNHPHARSPNQESIIRQKSKYLPPSRAG